MIFYSSGDRFCWVLSIIILVQIPNQFHNPSHFLCLPILNFKKFNQKTSIYKNYHTSKKDLNMEKAQLKPKKDKKKNNETGILMGQNINIFSQLSATYLTAKSNVTQEEEHFVKQTQIIEYHDQNINRIISLLRKKAEVTKAKAVQQLKQAVQAMSQNQINQFMPTFASLYQEIVVNEQSKQVFEEFIEITTAIFQKFKKMALKQIGTLFPAMLLSIKVSKINKLIFTGTQQQMNEKAYILLLKKQVSKKFLLVSKLLLQTDRMDLITQSNYQRNIYQYVKMLKDVLNIFLNHSRRKDLSEDTQHLVRDLCDLLIGKTPDQYFKAGGKGKTSLIEVYSYLVKFASVQTNEQIPWKKFAKVVCQHFLDKDPAVQSTLWKYCNKELLVSLKQLARNQQRPDDYVLFNDALPKSEQRLVEVLSLGGPSMYKALPSYLKQHPSFVIASNDGHKSIVQKISYMRKLLTQILSQEDQNQSRIQCYFLICEYVIKTLLDLENERLPKIIEKEGQNINDSKKAKEIKTLIQKLKIELITNLQKKYYSQPPASKNSFTYYMPEYFCRLLNEFPLPNFMPTFHEKLTFQLYKDIKPDSPLLDIIYSNSEQKLTLLLSFYETWPLSGKQVNLDMSENNQEYEKTAKVFLLCNKQKAINKNFWFKNDWDLRKLAIVYDPRLTVQDLQSESSQQTNELNMNFSPISKNIQEVYHVADLNENRFKFFLRFLEDNDIQTHNLKFFLPYLFTYLVTQQNVQQLLEKYLLRADSLKKGKWLVGQKQIAFLRVSVRFFNIYLLKHDKKPSQEVIIKFTPYFVSIGNFLKTLNAYKMDKDVLEIMKQLNLLLRVPQYESQLLQTVQNILKDIFTILNRSSIVSSNAQKEEKLRKNRLQRINDFVQESVWYLLKKNSPNYSDILLELFNQQHIWSEAESKLQPWAVGFIILSKSGESSIDKISKHMIFNFQQYYRIISLVFSCHFMLPLQIYPEYKRVYMQLQSGLSREFSQLSVDKQLFNIQQLMIYQLEKGLLTESLGLKNLLKNTLKYYQTFSPNDITTLSKEIVQLLFNKILSEPQTSNNLPVKSVIATNLLAQIPLQDLSSSLEAIEQSLLEILQKEVENLESHFSKFLSLCLLASNLWITPIGQTTLLKWEQQKIVLNLLNRVVPQINDIEPTSIYHSYVIFSTINSLYPTFGYELVEPNLDSIMRVFWQIKQDQRVNDMYIFKHQQRIKFINRVFLQIQKDAAHQIISKIPNQALQQYTHYHKYLLQLQEQQDDSTVTIQQKSIHGLFIEYSELLMKMTTLLNLGQKINIPDQTVLIQLLQCPFAGIKKTSFILLKQMYEFKLVKPAIPQVFKNVLTFKLKNDHDIEDLTAANQIYNFLYSWLTLITRRKAIQVASINQDEELTLEEYIQSSGLSELFLNNVFSLIADKIDYLKYENDFPLFSEQLLMDDFTLNVQEETNISQKLFTLASKVLFAYAINFPLFMRSFMDKSKKYRSVCEKLLRNYISDAIFSKQVAMIEIREPEWKSNGNLQIYVIKKNKEIYAEYQHDVIRIGLRLVMRPNYPLTPIHIQFGEGLKMEDGSKWALMLQSQLHNKNNSIINGVLLWKQNIDKKLSGIEECAICYDIVDPKGHIPKKSCKTCKKKFHSNCIMKWFSKSNKSECPLCKSQFL